MLRADWYTFWSSSSVPISTVVSIRSRPFPLGRLLADLERLQDAGDLLGLDLGQRQVVDDDRFLVLELADRIAMRVAARTAFFGRWYS